MLSAPGRRSSPSPATRAVAVASRSMNATRARPQARGPRHLHLHRDDPAGGRARRGQPGPGLPRLSRRPTSSSRPPPPPSPPITTSTPPPPGLPRLRRAIADHFQRRHGVAVDPDREVTVTGGATEGAVRRHPGADRSRRRGDRVRAVLRRSTCRRSRWPAARVAGGDPAPAALGASTPTSWPRAFGPAHQAGHPQHPPQPDRQGVAPRRAGPDRPRCASSTTRSSSADEVYSEITFDGARHVPIATRPGMCERTVTVDSLGKTFSVTGWKIGWAIAAPRADRRHPRRAPVRHLLQRHPVPGGGRRRPGRTRHANGYFDAAARRLRRPPRAPGRASSTGAGLPTLPVAGRLLPAGRHRPPRPFPDDVAFCRHLTTEVGVAAIPPSAFYADPRTAPRLARFCFAKSDETIAAAAERLAAPRTARADLASPTWHGR